MINAKNTLIAWNSVDEGGEGVPAGAVAIGPLLNDEESDWTDGYCFTGGAAEVARRGMTSEEQLFYVMRDWYELVYGYGLHPFIVHTAFLQIEEYQIIIKDMGMGPDKGELGHDPYVGYGRSVAYPVPEIDVRRIGRSVHVYPKKAPTPPPGNLGSIYNAAALEAYVNRLEV